jgi:hypothetical protein
MRAGWGMGAGGHPVGRDPRTMATDELLQLGHKPMSPMRAIRLRCLDCCAQQPDEVRKCTAVRCPSWPFRMSKNPWRTEPTDAQREEMRQRALKRGLGVRNQEQGFCDDEAEAFPVPGDRKKLFTGKTACSRSPPATWRHRVALRNDRACRTQA